LTHLDFCSPAFFVFILVVYVKIKNWIFVYCTVVLLLGIKNLFTHLFFLCCH